MSTEAVFLIVDDETEVCNFFVYLLKKKGYRAVTASSGREAIAKLDQERFDVALVDLKLPDSNGLEILKEIKAKQPACEVIIITGYSTVKSAVEAIQLGAFDYVEKPFVDIDEMERLLERSLNVKAELEQLSLKHRVRGFVVGKNPKMISLIAAAQKIAKKNITVLIQGETGTGKEVLARYIHAESHRADRPFIAFNCGAFTETLLESELFGHEKGSFTGATSKKKGLFELAHKATLFLDEIDAASPAIQIKLLRVLESGEFFRVGGEELCKVDVRVIAATNTNLAARVEENKFREDLFYRLDVASLHIPPLRERVEDIPLFLEYFLEKESRAKEIPLKKFSPEALVVLQQHSWPGNIRELANTVTQALVLSKGPLITVDDLPARIRPAIAGPTAGSPVESPLTGGLFGLSPGLPDNSKLHDLLEQLMQTLLEKINFREGFPFEEVYQSLNRWRDRIAGEIIACALEETYGNQVKAAQLLGITPRALRYHLQKSRETK
ncbi:MAG: sigma-54-dependent Fis family transcriptional regulator [Firmicutes bacterium]|nr:sigma-54-dependent Fis family transcriptional regulator [Bacillota bacterium]